MNKKIIHEVDESGKLCTKEVNISESYLTSSKITLLTMIIFESFRLILGGVVGAIFSIIADVTGVIGIINGISENKKRKLKWFKTKWASILLVVAWLTIRAVAVNIHH